MIYPRALKKGDTIGLIGISGAMKPSTESQINKVIKKVEDLGFRVKCDASVGQVYGYLSGSDQVRADAVNRMFLDREVRGVYCVRGGYGVLRILDLIDFDVINKNPKVFIGYSDITALHSAIHERCGLVTFHGPMPSSDDLTMQSDAFSRHSLLNAIMADEPLGNMMNPDDKPFETINGGEAEGLLVGGNLSLITAAMGTPYELNTKNKILFLEDIGEKTYCLDRMLTQLRLAGKFNDCAGIVLGSFTDCEIEDKNYGLDIRQIISDIIVPCGKPMVAGVQAGHCSPKLTLPLGAPYYLNAGKGTLAWI